MNFLTHLDIQAIDRFDGTNHRCRWGSTNRTRFYKYLLPAGNDMEVHTVAVKTKRYGTLSVVKEVVRASVDDLWQHVKDLACLRMGGYTVDWSPEKVGRPHQWSYNGRWESEAWGRRCKWKINCRVINPEALQQHPRFKYCSWMPECGDILDYLKAYVHHPKIELLSKIGAGRFGTKTGFVSQLERDKGLMRFFQANLPDIKESQRTVDVIRLAYKSGITMDEADTRIKARHAFKGMGLPSSVDAVKALNFVRYKSKWQYCQYLRNCVTLGMDLADTKVTFPKQFKQRQTIVNDRIAEIERRKNAEQAKAMDAQIAAIAKKFARFEKARGVYRLLLPRKAAELKREGQRLHNCLGDGHYAAKMARGETLIAFIRHSRKPGAAFVAVEFSPSDRKVLQCYGDKNQKPPAPVLKFVAKVFTKTRRAA